MKNNNTVVALLCLALMACAPVTKLSKIDADASANEQQIQKELALQQILKREVRATRVAYPILKDSAAHCEDNVAASIGAIITSSSRMGKDWSGTGSKLWGVTEKPTIISVLKDLPADKAGLKPGDQIAIIDGKIMTGPFIKEPLTAIAKPYKAAAPIAFGIIRDGSEMSVTVTPDPVCNYPIEVSGQDAVNAYADGKKIVITSGMMRFAETDDELATVIGHELAHNQMGHMEKKGNNQLIGVLIGALITAATGVDVTNAVGNIGAGAFSQDFEAEADYVGLYSCARAGYDINASPNFWRRMGAEHPDAISHGQSHPNTANRFLALENTVKEIDQKRASGEELLAEMKSSSPVEVPVQSQMGFAAH
jgi:hypothetical protein